MAAVAREAGVPIVMAIGIAMFCPYEGEIPEERVLGMIERMRSDGIEEFYVATSVGLDGPRKVSSLCSQILDRWPGMTLGIHLHNTNRMALANALAAMDAGAIGCSRPRSAMPFGSTDNAGASRWASRKPTRASRLRAGPPRCSRG